MFGLWGQAGVTCPLLPAEWATVQKEGIPMPMVPGVLVPPRPPAAVLRIDPSVMPPDIVQLIDVLARIERRRLAQRLLPVAIVATPLQEVR